MFRSDSRWLWEIAEGTISLMFPKRCAGCEKIDVNGFCANCISLFEWLDPSKCCHRCGAPILNEALQLSSICSACRRNPPRYSKAAAALAYTGPLAHSIILWKYHDQRYLSACLAELLTGWVSANAPSWWEEIEAIVPAPHHPETVKARGFQPTEELAWPLSSAFAIPYLPRVLFKTRHTPPQAGLNLRDRMENIRQSMKVFDPDMVEGRTILVVDDVMTTGATINECARALIEAGARKIYALVLARQGYGNRTSRI